MYLGRLYGTRSLLKGEQKGKFFRHRRIQVLPRGTITALISVQFLLPSLLKVVGLPARLAKTGAVLGGLGAGAPRLVAGVTVTDCRAGGRAQNRYHNYSTCTNI